MDRTIGKNMIMGLIKLSIEPFKNFIGTPHIKLLNSLTMDTQASESMPTKEAISGKYSTANSLNKFKTSKRHHPVSNPEYIYRAKTFHAQLWRHGRPRFRLSARLPLFRMSK